MAVVSLNHPPSREETGMRDILVYASTFDSWSLGLASQHALLLPSMHR